MEQRFLFQKLSPKAKDSVRFRLPATFNQRIIQSDETGCAARSRILVWTFRILVRRNGTEALLIFIGGDERTDHRMLLWHIAQRRAAHLAQPKQRNHQCLSRAAGNRSIA